MPIHSVFKAAFDSGCVCGAANSVLGEESYLRQLPGTENCRQSQNIEKEQYLLVLLFIMYTV